ncbi:centrosomal protein of 104 kDa [Diorhabda carinulata]|uniref:centrosomal protein of 104 kDa n=1 Tax=Diorhabda carinulata TaxID=1163345 RepID=UPI00259FEA11|nr:centrosomal protein of 104 kDa [Diorhabda carinulata]
MPKPVHFTAIYATSEDAKYRYAELNTHGPIIKGWQSEKNCQYPQEIILKLDTRCEMSKIQILSHQFMIPSKVELFLNNDDIDIIKDVANINWEYLGYITLSTNESTEFKSRELKSASVPKKNVTFLKINLLNNHFNCLNEYNQVSLIAINILGKDINFQRPTNSDSDEGKIFDILNDPDYYSPYDDLAFLMYVDVDVAKIIKEMEIKKHLAVIHERFEYARKLKITMTKLRVAGEKLAKYELEKKYAIDVEDYEKARHKKNQMEQFRSEIYEELCIEQLMEYNGVCRKNDEYQEEIDSQNKNLLSPVLTKGYSDKDRRSVSPHLNSQISPLHTTKHQSPKTGSPNTGSPTNIHSRGGSFRRRNKSAGAIVKSTYEMYEEKPLPALRHSQTNEFLRECHLEPDHKVTSKLTEREKKQAALPILLFGNDLVEKFYSKHYCDKEDGLNSLKDELLTYDTNKLHVPNKIARGAIFLLHRALRDKVFSVYNLANEVIRLFFVQFVPGRVTQAEVARSVDKLLPELLTKSGDTSQRINQMAVHTILTMADCKSVRELHIIPVHLSRPVNNSTHPRLALSRAEMVEQLIINHGISTEKQSGLTCRTLAEFGLSGLHHPAEPVRKVSERILVLVYRVNPRLVRKQLPPDDDITRRNLLYRQLFHEFDKIDVERKKEMLEKNRVLQQTQLPPISPEPVPVVFQQNGKIELSKCPSANNLKTITNEGYQVDSDQQKSHALMKSQSGTAVHTNGSNVTNNGQSSSSASAISSPSNTSQKEEEEKHCIFCKQTETSIFLVNNSMNSHYWRSCPMLIRCKECSQVVEVSTLTEHLLVECEQKERYTQCTICSEAVKSDKFQEHQPHCKDLAETCNRCPLCHENIEIVENCWTNHLMGPKPCTKNARIKTSRLPKHVKIKG